MKDIYKENEEIIKGQKIVHYPTCTYQEHDVCICDDIRFDRDKAADEAGVAYGAAFNPYNDEMEKERELFAAKRAANGKPPKVARGAASKEAKDQLLLGWLVESFMTSINLLEAAKDQKMMFTIDVPTSDNRKLSISLQRGE